MIFLGATKRGIFSSGFLLFILVFSTFILQFSFVLSLSIYFLILLSFFFLFFYFFFPFLLLYSFPISFFFHIPWFFLSFFYFNSFSPLSKPLGTVPSAPTNIDITFSLVFHSFFSSLARSKYFHSLLFSLCVLPEQQNLLDDMFSFSYFLFFFFLFFLIITKSDVLAGVKWPIYISQYQGILCFPFSRIDSGLRINNLEVCSVGWGCRIHRLHLCREVRHLPQRMSWYDTKQSDDEVPVILELLEIQSNPSLPSLSGPLWPGVVVSYRVLSIGQIELNCVLMLNWIARNKTALTFNLRTFPKLNCLK